MNHKPVEATASREARRKSEGPCEVVITSRARILHQFPDPDGKLASYQSLASLPGYIGKSHYVPLQVSRPIWQRPGRNGQGNDSPQVPARVGCFWRSAELHSPAPPRIPAVGATCGLGGGCGAEHRLGSRGTVALLASRWPSMTISARARSLSNSLRPSQRRYWATGHVSDSRCRAASSAKVRDARHWFELITYIARYTSGAAWRFEERLDLSALLRQQRHERTPCERRPERILRGVAHSPQ